MMKKSINYMVCDYSEWEASIYIFIYEDLSSLDYSRSLSN